MPRSKPKPVASRGHLVGVFGPFGSRALVEVPIAVAQEMIGEKLIDPAPALMVDSVMRDLALIRERAPDVADSALAASALALAHEMANPYNSATSKSMCARVLMDTMNRLSEIAPAKPQKDGLDELKARRTRRRRAGRADPAGLPGSTG